MSATFLYTFQPQPPTIPKTNGGKRGPSAPLPVSSSDDEEPELVTDNTANLPAGPLMSDAVGSRLTNKSTFVSSIPTSHNHFRPKRRGLATLAVTPASNNNNNPAVVNLNHVPPPMMTNDNHLLVPTTPPNPDNGNNIPGLGADNGNDILTAVNSNNSNIRITTSVKNTHPSSASSALTTVALSTAEHCSTLTTPVLSTTKHTLALITAVPLTDEHTSALTTPATSAANGHSSVKEHLSETEHSMSKVHLSAAHLSKSGPEPENGYQPESGQLTSAGEPTICVAEFGASQTINPSSCDVVDDSAHDDDNNPCIILTKTTSLDRKASADNPASNNNHTVNSTTNPNNQMTNSTTNSNNHTVNPINSLNNHTINPTYSPNNHTVNPTTSPNNHIVNPTNSPNNHTVSLTTSFAYEHDHDYESVSSPCSSTASGPIYVRPAGFRHHAQEIEAPHSKNKVKKKKYPVSLVTLRDGYKKREHTPPKLKPKRDPLPMKLRALPQSFWQQPNVAHQVSPAALYLPPLLHKDSDEALMDVRPVTPPDERDNTKKLQVPERKVTVTNTDLLLKLFEGVGERKKTSNSLKSRAVKARKQVPKSSNKGLFLGNDPYMVDAVVEKIFPQLTLEGSRHSSGGGNTSLQLITLREGDRTVTLPSLSLEQNYPQMLSELVMHI